MLTYRAREGEMLDQICQNYYGRTSGAVEAVLQTNPGLAAQSARLPAGTLVRLPELEESDEKQAEANLWR